MSCVRAPKRSGFVLTCDECGHQVGLAVDFAVEGFPLAARKGWTCAKVDRCPSCARKHAAKAPAKKSTRGAGASARPRAAASSRR